MYYIVESKKSMDQAAADLEAAIVRNGFGVMHVHDLGNTLRSKGVSFQNQCKVFEICNPIQASRVLAADLRINMALPCRISVFADAAGTKLGLIRPINMLKALSDDPALLEVAQEVEEKTIRMIDEAR
ncbi:MAG: DUF302 domain-containing protein [Candidatus Eisenbacteria bacterium]|nr:DUF302 domain-containing protein [Candidatus Eisenbacteria bacterium]